MERIAVSYAPSLPVVNADDIQADYYSALGEEERMRRFSEVLDDENLRETIRMEKMFRQIQRKVYFRNQMMAGVGDCVVFYFQKCNWSERSACAALGCWHKRRWPLF